MIFHLWNITNKIVLTNWIEWRQTGWPSVELSSCISRKRIVRKIHRDMYDKQRCLTTKWSLSPISFVGSLQPGKLFFSSYFGLDLKVSCYFLSRISLLYSFPLFPLSVLSQHLHLSKWKFKKSVGLVGKTSKRWQASEKNTILASKLRPNTGDLHGG